VPLAIRRLWASACWGCTETERIERLLERERVDPVTDLPFLDRLEERVDRRPLDRDRRDSPSLSRPSSKPPFLRLLFFRVRSRKKKPR
jgi:hypothetical protein